MEGPESGLLASVRAPFMHHGWGLPGGGRSSSGPVAKRWGARGEGAPERGWVQPMIQGDRFNETL